ncbi:restriction endonuclease subunit S [Poseidonibacter ostreae]|uniref:Restriction endonuclease subunit S n=2 Tax=Poseidonibacter ostreae TaxID=2654171 RepID=A0A6L4WTU2_9BACT|nr:restriction endonuclease subunit S [Poseidonibacter ostreae]KAB7889689.1 restriction endonuclease subunit S [Poseidonibacter ostreae]
MNLRFGALALYKNEKALRVSSYYNIFNVDEKIVNKDYFYAYLKSERIMFHYNRMATGSLEEKKRVHFKEFKKFIFPLPPLKEQNKISKILNVWNSGIKKQKELIAIKKSQRKELVQRLLSGVGKKEWKFKKLGELLDYEQPTKYLVSNTNYNDSYKTPVLTAGKTFILGYTNETIGIREENLPVIIFDDFTTANKFVDFAFKAKSSAMKILKAKDSSINIKLVYELMQMINFVSDDHKRYWISEYQELEVKVPPKEEEERIMTILELSNKEISLLEDEFAHLNEQKRGLMQKLLTGEVRVKI